MQDRPNENFVDDYKNKDEIVEIVDKRKYEHAVSECDKLITFVKRVGRSNITVLSEQ